MRADLRLAAWLRWMMPRWAALSSFFDSETELLETRLPARIKGTKSRLDPGLDL